jgi:Flp pilus assembly pilin Flp
MRVGHIRVVREHAPGAKREPLMPQTGQPSARGQRGQGLAEYALILAFIAVMAILAVTFLGGQINTLLSSIANAI